MSAVATQKAHGAEPHAGGGTRSKVPSENAKRWLLIAGIAAVIFAAVFVGYHIWHKRHAATEERQKRTEELAKGPWVNTAKVDTTSVPRMITVPGDVRGFQQTTLYAKIAGYVKDLRVERGQKVKADQILAVVFSPRDRRAGALGAEQRRGDQDQRRAQPASRVSRCRLRGRTRQRAQLGAHGRRRAGAGRRSEGVRDRPRPLRRHGDGALRRQRRAPSRGHVVDLAGAAGRRAGRHRSSARLRLRRTGRGAVRAHRHRDRDLAGRDARAGDPRADDPLHRRARSPHPHHAVRGRLRQSPPTASSPAPSCTCAFTWRSRRSRRCPTRRWW